MKSLKKLNLLGLSLLVACSSAHKPVQEVAQESYKYQPNSRTISSLAVSNKELSKESVQKMVKGIFHSYILGQTLLHDFDASLDKNPEGAMESEVYSELLAIRMNVEHFEEEIIELYLKLVMVKALPSYDEDQKRKANTSLEVIGQFVDGMVDNKEIPDNLKALVLGNLRQKQTELYEELSGMKSDSSLTLNDLSVSASIHEEMVKLRASRMKFFKAEKDYKVDEQLLSDAVAEMNKDKDFKSYRAQLKKMSKEIRSFNKAVRGRSTSSDVIYPNTSSNGNITGRSFPTNTWSLTFDDGPSSVNTPLVVQKLKNKGLKATFFMLAQLVEKYPNTAKVVVDADMDIASHSYKHENIKTLTATSAIDREIGGAKKIIETKLGKTIKLFRLPYGSGVDSTKIRTKIAEQNMIHVFWNVDTLDWQDKNADSIFARAKKQMAASSKNSGIILFHDIHERTIRASALLMDEMIKNKVNVCTVQGVVDQINKGLGSCQ